MPWFFSYLLFCHGFDPADTGNHLGFSMTHGQHRFIDLGKSCGWDAGQALSLSLVARKASPSIPTKTTLGWPCTLSAGLALTYFNSIGLPKRSWRRPTMPHSSSLEVVEGLHSAQRSLGFKGELGCNIEGAASKMIAIWRRCTSNVLQTHYHTRCLQKVSFWCSNALSVLSSIALNDVVVQDIFEHWIGVILCV